MSDTRVRLLFHAPDERWLQVDCDTSLENWVMRLLSVQGLEYDSRVEVN